MRLEMPGELAARYKSGSQRTRVVSEGWGEGNLYCPACTSPRLHRAPPNTEAIDFSCPDCSSPFQLKSQSHRFSARIMDAGYEAMRRTIEAGRTPNLFALYFEPARWQVVDLLLVPRFAFSLSCVERRNPLSPTARRHDYVLCNILLGNIPSDAKIPVVTGGRAATPDWVREQYGRLRPLERLNVNARGWTLDVLHVVRQLEKREFSLAEVYAFGAELRRLHPQNLHVDDKIRQQLQRLRDLGFVKFLGRGRYRLT